MRPVRRTDIDNSSSLDDRELTASHARGGKIGAD
jgi:hypothetical protein